MTSNPGRGKIEQTRLVDGVCAALTVGRGVAGDTS